MAKPQSIEEAIGNAVADVWGDRGVARYPQAQLVMKTLLTSFRENPDSLTKAHAFLATLKAEGKVQRFYAQAAIQLLDLGDTGFVRAAWARWVGKALTVDCDPEKTVPRASGFGRAGISIPTAWRLERVRTVLATAEHPRADRARACLAAWAEALPLSDGMAEAACDVLEPMLGLRRL